MNNFTWNLLHYFKDNIFWLFFKEQKSFLVIYKDESFEISKYKGEHTEMEYLKKIQIIILVLEDLR